MYLCVLRPFKVMSCVGFDFGCMNYCPKTLTQSAMRCLCSNMRSTNLSMAIGDQNQQYRQVV